MSMLSQTYFQSPSLVFKLEYYDNIEIIILEHYFSYWANLFTLENIATKITVEMSSFLYLVSRNRNRDGFYLLHDFDFFGPNS